MTWVSRRWVARVGSLSAVLAVFASLVICGQASAASIGYLYSAVGSNIDQYDVGADASLAPAGTVAGGPATPDYPGTLVGEGRRR